MSFPRTAWGESSANYGAAVRSFQAEVLCRYINASAKWWFSINGVCSRSAIVRATFNTRWHDRADILRCFIALCNNDFASSDILHESQTSTGPIKAFDITVDPWNRSCCSWTATMMRSRADAEPSSTGGVINFSYSTRGTSTNMSMRSINGPEIRR